MIWTGWLLAAELAGATGPPAVRPDRPVVENVEVRRAIVTVRVEPRASAPRGACDRLSPRDLRATISGEPARIAGVDHVPPPRMYWLILDTSGSTGEHGQRSQAKREATRWVREVLVPGRDTAAVLTIDEDLRSIVTASDDPEVLARAIDAVPPGAQSLLTDALDEVLAQVAGDRREHVVVFWTDGGEGLSLRAMPALRRRIGDAPNARVFPVAVQPDAGRGTRIPPQWLFELADATGGKVTLSADRRWLQFLRDGIHLRWRVAVAIPAGAPEGTIPTVRSANPSCEIAIVPDHGPPGDRFEGQPPAEWERERRRQRRRDDDAGCRVGEEPAATLGGVTGCVLDLAREQGLLYDPEAAAKVDPLTPARFAWRRWFVPTTEPELLHSEVWRILESLEAYPLPEVAVGDRTPPPSIHPLLVNGRTFFTMQGSVARALWESGPGWRDAARRRLAAEADRDVAILAEDLREQSPRLSVAESLAAAEAAPLGIAARAAVDQPTDADLRRAIGAWLGDVSARDLFLAWERAMIDRRLRGEKGTEAFERRWTALRRWFALPEHARSIVPLVPVRDPRRDVEGFWRILLPRPYWIANRREGSREDDPVPYDHVPPRPLAWRLVDSLVKGSPAVAARLASGNWRVAELDYAPAAKLWKEDPAEPYSSADVVLVLASGNDRLSLRARIDDRGDGSSIVTLATD